MKIIKLLCISIICAVVIISGFLVHLFKVYPKVEYTVPFMDTQSDYRITSVDGVNLLVYHDLPYPTDFEKSSYLVQNLGDTWKMRLDPEDTGIDNGWHLIVNPGDNWTDVDVPSSYDATDGSTSGYYGVAWFFLRFSSDFTADDETFVRLGFGGVCISSDVWLNGEYLGDHRGSGTPFYFDVSDLLATDENILVVRTDNRPGYDTLPVKTWEHHTPGAGMSGGIHRDVILEKIPRHYICKAVTDMAISKNRGAVSISVVIHNHDLEGPYILSGTLISPDGEETDLGSYIYESSGEFDLYTLSCEVENPKTWSPNHPWLYRLVLSLKTKDREETLETKTGFRTVGIVGYGTDPGVYINDINTTIRGISRFEDDMQLGTLPTSDFIARDLDLVQDMNANFIRMAGAPHDVREIRACRDRGIMVSEEIPYHGVGLGWVEWYQSKGSWFELPVRTFGMRQLNDPVLMSQAQRMLIEMVERDINNPAVIMWIVGSESCTLFDEGGRFHGWMRNVIRLFDDTRPVCTTEYTYDFRACDSRSRTAEHMDLIAIDSFFGWKYGSYEDVEDHLEHIHRRYPDRLIFLSGFGAGSGCAPSEGIATEKYQAKLIREYVDISRSKKYVTGVCPTTFADMPHPGDMARSLGCMGVLSADREPKAAYDALSEIYLDIRTGGK